MTNFILQTCKMKFQVTKKKESPAFLMQLQHYLALFSLITEKRKIVKTQCYTTSYIQYVNKKCLDLYHEIKI